MLRNPKFAIYQIRTWNNHTAIPGACRHNHRSPFRAWRCQRKTHRPYPTSICASDDQGKRWRQLGFQEVDDLWEGKRHEAAMRAALTKPAPASKCTCGHLLGNHYVGGPHPCSYCSCQSFEDRPQ